MEGISETMEYIFNNYIFQSKIGRSKYDTYYSTISKWRKNKVITNAVVTYLKEFGYEIVTESVTVKKIER